MTILLLYLTFVIVCHIMLDKMITLRSTDSARPDSSDCATRLASLREQLTLLKRWAVLTENVTEEFSELVEFENLLAHAVFENGDAYDATKWLDDFVRWEVDTELVLILHRVYEGCTAAAERREKEWVMANGVRFPAKEGQQLVVLIGGEKYPATVKEVNKPYARASVYLNMEVGEKSGDVGIIVNAEEVVEVLS